jgi:hypothetical protein
MSSGKGKTSQILAPFAPVRFDMSRFAWLSTLVCELKAV